MTRSEIERAVARATGESRATIRSYGFTLLPEEPDTATDPSLVLDCPGCGSSLDATTAAAGIFRAIECPRCDAVYPFALNELYVADGPNADLAVCA